MNATRRGGERPREWKPILNTLAIVSRLLEIAFCACGGLFEGGGWPLAVFRLTVVAALGKMVVDIVG